MKKVWNNLHNDRGSALVMVFMVLMVLLVMGMGVMVLSMGSAKQAVVTDTYEKLYYPAEGSSTQGVDFVKTQALASYNDIASDMQSGFTPSEAEFFQYLDARVLGAKFAPAQMEMETASPGSRLDGLDASISSPGTGNPREYTVSSTASGTSLARTVLGKIFVKYVPPVKSFQPFGNSPLIVGSSLELASVKQNTELVIPDGVEVRYKADNTPAINDPRNCYDGAVYPLTHDTKWVLTFDMFMPITVSTVNQAPKNNEDIKNLTKNVVWNIVGESGASFSLDNVTLNNGGTIICSNTNSNGLELTDCVLKNVTIVSNGDITISDSSISNSSIISKGNITFNGGTITNSNVFCGGKFTIGNENDKNTTLSSSIVYAMSAEVGRQGNGKTEVVAGLFYTYNDLTVNGNKYGYFKGQVVSNGSVTLTDEIPNKDAMFISDPGLMNNLPSNAGILGSNPFSDTLSDLNGGSLYTIVLPVMSDIIASQNVGEQ